jgi:hypothetical protein
MAIPPLSNNVAAQLATEAASQARGTQKIGEAPKDDGRTLPAGGVAVQVSPAASFLREVQALQQVAEPQKLQTALAQAARELTQAAKQSPGPEAQLFSKLADRFTAAARTGDLAQLVPDRPPQSTPQAGFLAAYQAATVTDTTAALRASPKSEGQQDQFPHRRGGQGNAEAKTQAALGSILAELKTAVGAASERSGDAGSGSSGGSSAGDQAGSGGAGGRPPGSGYGRRGR